MIQSWQSVWEPIWVAPSGSQSGLPQMGQARLLPDGAPQISSLMGCPRMAPRLDDTDGEPHIGSQIRAHQAGSQMRHPKLCNPDCLQDGVL